MELADHVPFESERVDVTNRRGYRPRLRNMNQELEEDERERRLTSDRGCTRYR